MSNFNSSTSRSAAINEKDIRLFMLKSNILEESEINKTPDVVKLKHPRTGAGALFLFSSDNSIIQEVFLFSEKRSWFFNDAVKEKGNMYLSTPIDPLFLVLPYLKKNKEVGKVVPLEDLLIDDIFPETFRLFQSVLKQIQLVADKKGSEDLNAWMYNEEKVVKWLTKKAEKVVHVLKEKQSRGSATSKNFIKSSKEESLDFYNETYLKYAHGLISEYLTDDLSVLLSKSLQLSEESPEKKSQKKRKPSINLTQGNNKKVKAENQISNEIVKKSEESNSTKKKPIKKAPTGSKMITSFFVKK